MNDGTNKNLKLYGTPEELGLKEGIISPNNGWESNTHYVVEVAFNHFTPIQKSIFFTGFIETKGEAGFCNKIFSETGVNKTILSVYYLKAVSKIEMEIFQTGDEIKLINL